MIQVVLDTNVLVSAVISPTGPNAQVFELILADKLRPYVTSAVIEEYDRGLNTSTSSTSTNGGWPTSGAC